MAALQQHVHDLTEKQLERQKAKADQLDDLKQENAELSEQARCSVQGVNLLFVLDTCTAARLALVSSGACIFCWLYCICQIFLKDLARSLCVLPFHQSPQRKKGNTLEFRFWSAECQLLVQLKALKGQIREAAADHDAKIQEAKEPLLVQIQELEDRAGGTKRMESMLRAARKAASQSDGQVQVLVMRLWTPK